MDGMDELATVLAGDSAPEAAPAPEQDAAQEQPDETVKTPEQVFTTNKANAAFAEMRAENTRYRRTLQALGETLGVANPTDSDALLQGLNTKILEYQSQAKQIPYDILQELEALKEVQAQHERSSLAEQATLGFQKVKDTYGLTQKQLEEFAQALMQDGLNPYTAPINLVDEYKVRNFDALMEKVKKETETQVLQRQAKVDKHSTTPVIANSAPTGAPTARSSMSALRDLLQSK